MHYPDQKTGGDCISSRKIDCPAGRGGKNNNNHNYSCINITPMQSSCLTIQNKW